MRIGNRPLVGVIVGRREEPPAGVAMRPLEAVLDRQLAVGAVLAVGDDHLRDLARRFRLGLDRADHLFTPAVADQRIGDAHHIFIGGVRSARRRQHCE